jgi:ABC-type sulfate transport system permease component
MFENPERILVLFLSAALLLFLILAIILAVKAIQVTNKVKKVTDSAEKLVDNAEHVAAAVFKAAPLATFGKVVLSAIKKAKDDKKSDKNEEEEDK